MIRCLLLLFVVAIPASAQSLATLKEKFGDPITTFEVSPGMILVVDHDAEGKISRMTFEQTQARPLHGEESPSFSSLIGLDAKLVTKLLDELVPLKSRGGNKRAISFGSGCNSVSSEIYEYLEITRAGGCEGLYSVQVIWKKR